MPEDISAELYTLATNLYGTTADLGFVTRHADKEQHADEIRTLLRQQCGLVQDPVSGVWMQLLPGPARFENVTSNLEATDG